ncbi:MAG: sensor histidine kinase N-terminal domain-containing protein [Proteobacteria bacterium]|nr:sensor histidine kinase N-terminal domain-containing protein [Pseudomonadota bacterium]
MSLRVKLLGLITVSTFIAWGFAAYRSFLDTKQGINELFDAHLSESARAILQQSDHERLERRPGRGFDGDDDGQSSNNDHDDEEIDLFDGTEVPSRGLLFEKRLYFQLRGASGEFLTGSMGDRNPQSLASSSVEGFSHGQYKDENIRVFSAWNQERTLNVQVAESNAARSVLINSSLRNVLTPILFMIAPLILVLFLSVEFALRPLRRLSREVER